MNSNNRIKILFLAADPSDASRLRLQQECRDIEEKLQLAKYRERFLLRPRLSARVGDITQAIFDIEPQIVHFSGHGTSTGTLCFEDVLGQTKPVEPIALAGMFRLFLAHGKPVEFCLAPLSHLQRQIPVQSVVQRILATTPKTDALDHSTSAARWEHKTNLVLPRLFRAGQ